MSYILDLDDEHYIHHDYDYYNNHNEYDIDIIYYDNVNHYYKYYGISLW